MSFPNMWFEQCPPVAAFGVEAVDQPAYSAWNRWRMVPTRERIHRRQSNAMNALQRLGFSTYK
jgi:hypothetical protein